jgi:nicotinate phosphoribosyltransferase
MSIITPEKNRMQTEELKTAEGFLFTDFYQLTMAQLYFRMGMHENPVQFDYFFRNYPDYNDHKTGYCINAGLEWLLGWMERSCFQEQEVIYLREQTGQKNTPIFEKDFLDWLKENGNFHQMSIRAIPEGRVVHPGVPIAVVQGPFAMAQIMESSLLNHLNYQILVATKAARIKDAGRGQLLLEFGLRRAQGKGANQGSRAALIGGADFTSNTGISYMLGYPPKGTHAHSMVQAFMAWGGSELDAFKAYADVYPDDCLLLVDTINTLESGVPNAIKVFEALKRKGHRPMGIRLDSGDLAYLAINAARMLDDAGFPDTKIVLSNKLDELVIWQIITQIEEEAQKYGVEPDKLISRLIYGVGTNLVTSKGCGALDGVYKLAAVKKQGRWEPAMKLSESPSKTINPGNKYVWRIYDERKKAVADLVGLEEEEPSRMEDMILRHPVDANLYRTLNCKEISSIEPLHREILSRGKLVTDFPDMEEIRTRRKEDLKRLDAGVKRLDNPHIYHVSLTEKLWNLKQELIQSEKAQAVRKVSKPS